MIKVFSGNWRGLGRREKALGVIISFEFREYLKDFPGARLHVFIDLILHSDDDGKCWPSYKTIHKETGYGEDTIGVALKDLCKTTINGNRVLLRWRERDSQGRFSGTNHYQLFPTPEEVTEEETGKPSPDMDFPGVDAPDMDFPGMENTKGRNIHVKDNTIIKDKPEGEDVSTPPENPTWTMINGQLKSDMNQVKYNWYVGPLTCLGVKDNKFILSAMTPEIRDWCRDHLSTTINRHLAYLSPGAEVEFVLGDMNHE